MASDDVSRRVAVIGAGMSGLAALKECVEAGLDPVAFEGEDDLGGVWNFSEDQRTSTVYRSTCINTSRDANALGNYPVPSDWPLILHWSHMMRYFRSYAEHHRLLPRVRFATKVLRAEPLRDGDEWEVESAPAGGGAPCVERFGAVLVCTGHHCTPRMPDFPGRADFRGAQLHSGEYKDPQPFAGKRVVIVGIGNSGSDLVTEVSKVAEQTWLVARQGVWLFKNANGTGKPAVFSRFDSTLFGYLGQSNWEMLVKNDPDMKEGIALCKKHGLEPVHGPLRYHPTVTFNSAENNMIDQLKAGKICGKRGVQSIQPRGVTFTDGSAAEGVDAIIFCTGYKIGYPFLTEGVRRALLPGVEGDNEVRLFHYMWPIDGPRNLAFIGLSQPVGAMTMVAGMQTRYAAAVLSRRVSLPPPAAMRQKCDAVREFNRQWYYTSPRHTIQMCVRQYLDEVGEAIGGVTPTVRRLLVAGGIRLTALALLTPTTSFHYWLVGPGADLAAARAALLAEYRAVYRTAANRRGVGLVIDVLSKVLLLIPMALLRQARLLVTTGQIRWEPWV